MGHAKPTPPPSCHLPGCKDTTPPGMLVCGRHADMLTDDLVDVPGLLLALEAAHGKQLHYSTTRAAPLVLPEEEESPLPFNPKASEVAGLLVDTLTRWADLIARSRGLFRPLNTPTALPVWLCSQVSWLRGAECGPEAVAKIRAVIRAARLVVDRPPDLAYAGPCGGSLLDDDGLLQVCTADLYARPGELQVTCRVCGTRYPLAERRKWLLAKTEDMLLPATELARAIDGLGVDVTPSAIWKWKERGRIVPHGTDPAGHPLYRVGDIMDLVNATAVRTAAARR